jgi:hypothetical protein
VAGPSFSSLNGLGRCLLGFTLSEPGESAGHVFGHLFEVPLELFEVLDPFDRRRPTETSAVSVKAVMAGAEPHATAALGAVVVFEWVGVHSTPTHSSCVSSHVVPSVSSPYSCRKRAIVVFVDRSERTHASRRVSPSVVSS